MADQAPAEPVLVDRDLDERLARDGIVSVPLVDPEELRSVEEAYWALVPRFETGIVLDYLRADRHLVRELSTLMEPIWARVLPGVFEHHYPVYTSFVVKHPGAESSLFLHRDLCVDDERQRRTFSMWMPFTDTGPALDNGPLAFVPGSERIGYGGFGPNAVGLFAPYEHHLRKRLQPMSVAAGTALVYDARMLHASAPNHTDRVRLAVGCLLARRDQPVIQVVATGRRHRRVHEVDHDYFVDHAPEDIARNGMPARYPILDEYDETPATTTDAVLDRALDPADCVREVIVPADLEAMAGARRPLDVVRGPAPAHAQDLSIVASDLDPADGWAGGVHVGPSGGVGARRIAGRRHRVAGPAAVPDLHTLLGRPTRDAHLLVLDPGARAALTARRRHQLVVLECPAVRSGAATTDHVAELDLGVRVSLDPGRIVQVWNDGPGPLVAVVRSLSRRGWSVEDRRARRARDAEGDG